MTVTLRCSTGVGGRGGGDGSGGGKGGGGGGRNAGVSFDREKGLIGARGRGLHGGRLVAGMPSWGGCVIGMRGALEFGRPASDDDG